jgi:hypothetical protein
MTSMVDFTRADIENYCSKVSDKLEEHRNRINEAQSLISTFQHKVRTVKAVEFMSVVGLVDNYLMPNAETKREAQDLRFMRDSMIEF